MLFKKTISLLLVGCLFLLTTTFGHDSSRTKQGRPIDIIAVPNVSEVPIGYINTVDKKIEQYQQRVHTKTLKTLRKLSRWEEKLKGVIQKADASLAEKLFENRLTFSEMHRRYVAGEAVYQQKKQHYDAYRDKLTTSLLYIDEEKEKLAKEYSEKITKVKAKMEQLNKEVDEVNNIERLIEIRKKELYSAALSILKNHKYFKRIHKETWYYKEMLKNYKEIFSDGSKMEMLAKQTLNKIPAFREFTRQNSLLSKIFQVRGESGSANEADIASLAGLQTREQIGDLINNAISGGGENGLAVFKQNMEQAQSRLNSLKTKLQQKTSSTGGGDMADFKPNLQKTRTFRQRLEFGFNVQPGKQHRWLPNGAEFGLSVGYKLNDKSLLGIGLSYKMGIGSIDKIRFTHEGVGLRSFMDWKLKKQFYVTGGFEMNYLSGFERIRELKAFSNWQQSGLIGISRKIPIKTKFSKGTKIELLYDFLSTSSGNGGQPFKFRIGYNF